MVYNFKQLTAMQKTYTLILYTFTSFFLLFSPVLFAADETDETVNSSINCQEIQEEFTFAHMDAGKKIMEDGPLKFLDNYYKNLDAKPSPSLKIPKIIHHIWLTNAEQRREISPEDIKTIILARNIHSGKEWSHIVWTNDKKLIPNSVKVLEANDIKVRELSEIEDHLVLKKSEDVFIKKGLWGMASDVLRYDIVNYMGGVYTDVDFEFARSIEKELYTYDFLGKILPSSSALENYFFCSKANHPILIEALALIAKSCNDAFIASLDEKDLKNRGIVTSITNAQTYGVFCYAYSLKANQNNSIDAVYPTYFSSFDEKDEKNMIDEESMANIARECAIPETNINFFVNLLKFVKTVSNNDICGVKSYNIGDERDGANGAATWAQ